jgi:hypothetical protein
MFIALVALFILWNRNLRRYSRAVRETHDQRMAALEKGLESLEEMAVELDRAGLAVVSAMHCHYHVDDESLPGLTLVTCHDCGENLGSITDPGDVITLANVHVKEKFAAMRTTVSKGVKQDQS